jgi:hypothetical protein
MSESGGNRGLTNLTLLQVSAVFLGEFNSPLGLESAPCPSLPEGRWSPVSISPECVEPTSTFMAICRFRFRSCLRKKGRAYLTPR